MYTLRYFPLQTALLTDFSSLNEQLIWGLEQYINDPETRKTHEFSGRYENIYIDTEKIPALKILLSTVTEIAAVILNRQPGELRAGLWFNLMNPGDKTTLHQHDDDDELLSAVYYIKVPENSGTLILHKTPIKTQVTPQEGMFAFFPPDMPHEVTENMSNSARISLGINIGPLHPDDNN